MNPKEELNTDSFGAPKKPKSSTKSLLGKLAIIVLIIQSVFYVMSLNKSNADFPTYKDILIEKGETVKNISIQLGKNNIIRSPLYFKFILYTKFDNSFIQAGSYSFPRALSTTEVARAITVGEFQSPPTKITFPEGFRITNLNDYLPEQYGEDDVSVFKKYEGYLFPDTYFFDENASVEEIILRLRDTFDEKIKNLEKEIEQSPFTLEEIVILASILEREANDEESMKIVAGILIDRLNLGMALQVDATFEYLFGKRSDELTLDDLEINSPYNTYNNRGLPPTPISNPGIMAIRAVLNPIKTDYLYYLTDNNGKFHYAQTFEEHKNNKIKYLK